MSPDTSFRKSAIWRMVSTKRWILIWLLLWRDFQVMSAPRFRVAVCIFGCMNLSSLLSNISRDEVLDARKHAGRLSRQRTPSAARDKRIMDQYPAAGVIMLLPVKPEHQLFTKEKP